MKKTIIIADDHPFTIEGMSTILKTLPDVRIVATAQNGIDAIARIKTHKPDCAILDLSMPGANGLEVFKECKRLSPRTKFIIITGISAAALFKKLDDAGIDGLFVKNTSPDIICDGVTKILAGERVISEQAQAAIKTEQTQKELTPREHQVLEGLAKGLNNREIADSLNVSPKTIDSHRTGLLKKMNVNSTASLLVKAIRSGLLDV